MLDLHIGLEIGVALALVSFLFGILSGSPNTWRKRWRATKRWFRQKPADVAVAVFPSNNENVEVHRSGIRLKFRGDEEE